MPGISSTMGSIFYINRENNLKETELIASSKMLKWQYSNPLGKATLHLLMKRKCLSAFSGWFMSSRLSKPQIVRFVTKCKLDLSDYIISDYKQFQTFNEFFCRKINPKKRPIADGVVSPADCRVLAFPSLNDVTSFFIKGTEFSVGRFLQNNDLEKKYKDGAMLIARLAPTDYHRFHFPADGIISASNEIKGKYFSVSPLALKKSLKIFCENIREYSTLKTQKFGDILICEIGATMVGTILQTYEVNQLAKAGSEKGYFAFGGSTIVMLFEKGKVKLADDLCENTKAGLETLVKMGENIGSTYQGTNN